MSVSELKPYSMRIGLIDCACALPSTADAAGRSDHWRLSATFGAAVIAQALLLTTLPVAGQLSAPSPLLANLPYALTWLGAALASFPAALLVDQFGRRAAFALGASTGAAGGLLSAWAVAQGNFPVLCVGSIWLGIAQGFAVFYRHAGGAQQNGAKTILTIMAGGSVAALLVPGIVTLATQTYAPFTDCALLVVAGGASAAALPLILTLPHDATRSVESQTRNRAAPWMAAAIGATSWGLMSYVMAGTPHVLAGCGVGIIAVSGLISWHFLAMYGPLAIGDHLTRAVGIRSLSRIAILLLLCALLYPPASGALAGARLLIAGFGWSLAQIASASLLHAGGVPGRRDLAFQDVSILLSALAGALLA